MECAERLRLLIEYDRAIVDAFLAADALLTLRGDVALADYRVLLHTQERSDVRIGKARSAYEQHVIKHGCTLEDPT